MKDRREMREMRDETGGREIRKWKMEKKEKAKHGVRNYRKKKHVRKKPQTGTGNAKTEERETGGKEIKLGETRERGRGKQERKTKGTEGKHEIEEKGKKGSK